MPRAAQARSAPGERRTRPATRGRRRPAARPARAQASGYCSTEAANWTRHQRADRARPAEFVAPQGAQRGLRHGGRRHGVGQRDRQAEALDQPAEHVVVGQVVHQGGEAADPLQRLPPQHHGGAEAVLPPHGARQQGAGEEVVVDLHGAEAATAPSPNPLPQGEGERRYSLPLPLREGVGGRGPWPEAPYRPSSPAPHLAPPAPRPAAAASPAPRAHPNRRSPARRASPPAAC